MDNPSKKMNPGRKLSFILIVIFLFCVTNAYAIKSRKDYFFKPQIGAWFGPITPVAETAKLFDTNLGGGIFFRYNLPASNFIMRYFKLGFDASYQFFESKGLNKIHFV